MDIILGISILLNVIFITLLIRVFYYGKEMWTEIIEHDRLIDSLYNERKDIS